jgi:hypothetical protein
MINLLERYFKEREGVDTIYFNDDAFMMFKFVKEGCLITATYVLPECRSDKISHKLAGHVEKICKARKVKMLFCETDERSNLWDGANKNILKYGFSEYDKDGSIHRYSKEVF